MSEIISTEVLIVGAGPVGLSLAIELGHRGIHATVVERHDRVGQQPRAKTTNVRSMEHMRRWGLAETIRRAAPLPADYPTDIVFATRLFGRELARFENAFYGLRKQNELFSEPAQWIPQYTVEAVLRDHVLTLPTISLHMSNDLTDFEQTADGVRATVTNLVNGTEWQIDAEYLIGADGSRSMVRSKLGIKLDGQYGFAQNCGIVYRAPGLTKLHPQKPAIMYWLVNPEQPGVTGPMDTGDLWFMIMPAPNGVDVIGEPEARAAVLGAIGTPHDIEIVTIDPWQAHSLLADSYGHGRVFLAGDACHLHPPFGGYGMNLGIGDAVDLGWKLAAVLRGWGGSLMLASYEMEKRPEHQKVVEEAVANNAMLSQHLIRDGMEAAGSAGDALRKAIGAEILEKKIREFRTLGVVLGIPTSGSSLIVPDGTEPPAWHFSDYRPSASPGCLAPHLWLAEGDSLYDRFGADFTLLITGPGAEDDIEHLRTAARTCRMPLKILNPGDDRLRDLYGARLVLIRPDQHVAWRGDRLDRPATALLHRVCGGRDNDTPGCSQGLGSAASSSVPLPG
jgi:2-polyprenyl-6-methoxyphenol hydroxylase-like FAD-dependent oxidoreductase